MINKIKIVSRVFDSTEEPYDAIEAGEYDLGVTGVFCPQVRSGFYKQDLFQEKLVGVVREGHPLLSAKPTAEDLNQHCFVVYSKVGDSSGVIGKRLKDFGFGENIRVTVSNPMTVGLFLKENDYVCLMPEQLAKRLKCIYGLKTFELPINDDAFMVRQIWHERMHNDPAHKWFRKLVLQAYEEIISLKA